MARPSYPSDDVDKLLLRFPQGMRNQIKAAADISGRSMNAEIIHRLARSLAEDEADTLKVNLPGETWNALMADAAINNMQMDERAADILQGAFDQSPDYARAMEQIQQMANEMNDLHELVYHLGQKSDADFILYHTKATQLHQFCTLVLANDGSALPDTLRKLAKELQDLTLSELQTVRRRHDEEVFKAKLAEEDRKRKEAAEREDAEDTPAPHHSRQARK